MTSHVPPPPNHRRLAEIERELAALRREVYALPGRTAQTVPPRIVRLARTAKDYNDEYPPEPCNTYPIIFLDGAYDKVAGLQDVDYTDRSATRQEYAYDKQAGRYFAEATVVEVLEQNGRWWIIGAPGPLFAIVQLSGTWEAGECEPCDPPDVPLSTFAGVPLATFAGASLYLMEGVDEADWQTWPVMREAPVVKFFCQACEYEGSAQTLDVWHIHGYQPSHRDEVQALHKDTGYWPAKLAHGAWAWAIYNDDTLRWELLAEYEDIWRFELQEDLNSLSEASAKLVLRQGSSWDVVDLAFNVTDSLGMVPDSVAVSGTQGYAKYFADSDKWEVLALQATSTKAKWILFTLVGTLTTSSASQSSVTVSDYWQGSDPGSTVTLYNVPASSNYIFSGSSGAKGLACYDDIEQKYKIVQIEC